MALHYFDTSALAKGYLLEKGSRWVHMLMRTEAVGLSQLVVPEMASVLARRVRGGELSSIQGGSVFAQFLEDAKTYIVLQVSQSITEQAAHLLLSAATLPLRALDAIHLATAQACFRQASRQGESTGALVAADRRLLDAARWAGLPVLNPEDQAEP